MNERCPGPLHCLKIMNSDETQNDIPAAIGNLAEKAAIVFDWRMIVAKYGFTAFLVLILLGVIRYDVIQPQRKSQEMVNQSLIDSNKLHAEAAKDHAAAMMKMADVQSNQNSRLDSIDNNQRQTVTILERVHEAITAKSKN